MDSFEIIGYGTYISPNQLPVEELISMRHDEKIEQRIGKWKDGLGVEFKSVAGQGEDTITISAMALRRALESSGIDKGEIESIHLGTESPQYEVGNAAGQVGKLVGIKKLSSSLTSENACNAGIEALVKSGTDTNAFAGIVDRILQRKRGPSRKSVAIGADLAQASKGDPLEKATGAGGTAFILGKSSNPIAEVKEVAGYSTATPDFFRREGQSVPNHFGPTTVPAYLQHVTNAIGRLLKKKTNLALSDTDHFAFHSPSSYMVKKQVKLLQGETAKGRNLEDLLEEDVRERMKITEEDYKTKVEPYLDVVKNVGNLYSGSTPTVIARIFDQAEPGDKILATSYGSGASAKSLYIEVKDGIRDKRQGFPVKEQIESMREIGWKEYKKLKESRKKSDPDWKTAKIEPLGNSETREISICNNCGLIHFPSLGSYFIKECLNPKCEDGQVRKGELPRKARIKNLAQESAPYEESPEGVVVPIIGEVEPGETVEAVPRRIKTDGEKGILEYGWAYKRS